MTRTFEFHALLADSRAIVKVSCEMDQDGDVLEFNSVLFNGFDVSEVLSQNQWDDLEYDAHKLYSEELDIQSVIDFENAS